MKLAIFSDIHGNITALREVLRDIDRENVDKRFCLGDLVGYGPHPNEVKLVHGSPRKINEYLFFDRPAQSLNRILKKDNIDILICGHTHLSYVRYLKSGIIINDGSVGKPKAYNEEQRVFTSEAGYLIINLEKDEISIEHRKIPYDYEKLAKEIEETELPDHFANIIRGIKDL